MYKFIETLERIHVAVTFAEHGLYQLDGSSPVYEPVSESATPAGAAV